MTLIGERHLLVLGSRILNQEIRGFEIDRLVIKEHSPYAFGCQDLFSLVAVTVYNFN
jgi:hypothetical protein